MKRLIPAMLALAVVMTIAPAVLGAPRLVIPESEFDFGYAPQNSHVSHTFWLHNQGDDSLLIKKVVPG